MKTFGQLRKENKAKLRWLKRVTEEDLSDVMGLLRGNQYQEFPFIEIDVRNLKVTTEMDTEILGLFDERYIGRPLLTTVEVEGTLRASEVI